MGLMGLIDLVGWLIAIGIFVLGVISLIGMFVYSGVWGKFLGVVAVLLGVFVFIRAYAWLNSIGFSLFASGFVLAFFGAGAAGHSSGSRSPAQREEKQYTVTDAVLDTVCEYELTKAAVKDAIRESKQ